MTPEPVRNLLVALTGFIPNEEIAGLVFGFGLVITDHISNVVYAVIGE